MARCQCCGQILPPKGLPEGISLTPTQRRICDAVISWPGISSRDVMDWVYGNNPDGGPESRHVVPVQVNSINRKLRPHGFEISAMRGGSDGYRLKEIS